MTSELAVPLRFGDDIIGVINFESTKEHAFTDLHEGLITSLATQAAMLIKLTQLFELQKRNQELELREAQSRDIADILHRINNPLGLVQQYAKFALERCDELGLDDSQLQADLQKAFAKGNETANLISRLRSDLRDVQAYPIDVNEQLQLALQEYRGINSTEHIEFALQLTPDLPTIRCGNKLKRVFFDLIKNSVEAIGEHSGTLTIISRRNNIDVEVLFQDTGSGIPLDVQEYIFEDWFFTPKKSSDAQFGRGLGLYWAQKFLTAYNADIKVDSKPGDGTTMIITFRT